MHRRLPLPPNESPLEIALAAALALPDDLLNLHEVLGERLKNPADEDLPFLVWEWGLQPVLPFLDNPRRALAEGRRWQKIRGTIPAGHIARSWIDAYAAHEQERSKRTHLHLAQSANESELDGIITLSRLSQSLRSDLYRITWQLDHRALIKGRRKRTNSIRSNSSGIRFRPDWPLISFQENVRFVAPWQYDVSASIDVHIGIVSKRRGDIIRSRSIKPARSKLSPPSAINHTLELPRARLGWLVDAMTVSSRPIAGIIRAASKRGALQSVRGAYRLLAASSFRRSRALRPFGSVPHYIRLPEVPEPARVIGKTSLSPTVVGDVALTVCAHVTVNLGPATCQSEVMIGAVNDLGGASWSGLPPSDASYGSSPSSLVIAELT